MLNESLTSEKEVIYAKDLVVPILLLLTKSESIDIPFLTVTQIRDALKPIMVLSEKDKEVSPDRVSHFERTIRNTLASHKTLENQGLVKSFVDPSNPSTYHIKITHKGRKMVSENVLEMFKGFMPPLESLVEQVENKQKPELPVNTEMPRKSPYDLSEIGLLSIALLQKESKGAAIPLPVLRQGLAQFKGLEISPLDQRNLLRSHENLLEYGMITKSKAGLKLTNLGYNHLLKSLFLNKLPAPPQLEAPAVPKSRLRLRVKP